MPYRELNFDTQNLTVALSEVKQMFPMHFEQGCQYVVKRAYDKALAVDFDGFINAGRYQRNCQRRSHRNGCVFNKGWKSLEDNCISLPATTITVNALWITKQASRFVVNLTHDRGAVEKGRGAR